METITVGGEEILVPPIKGWKFVRASQILSRLSGRWTETLNAMGDFRVEYQRKHKTLVPRALAELRAAEAQEAREAYVTQLRQEGEIAEDTIKLVEAQRSSWERLLDGALQAPDSVLEMPEEPGLELQVAAVLPKWVDAADKELVQLLGLMVAPNDELRDLFRQGGFEKCDERITELGHDLMFTGDIDELVALAMAIYQRFQEQLEGKAGPTGELWRRFTRFIQRIRTPGEELDQVETPTSEPSDEPQETTTSSEGSSDGLTSDESSTSSPASTDGPNEKSSSTVPSGVT